MKKSLLSKLGLLIMCFGLMANFTACSSDSSTSDEQSQDAGEEGNSDSQTEGEDGAAE